MIDIHFKAIERLGGSAMKKEGDAFKKKTFFESTDNARLSAIEDSITDIKEALKDGRMVMIVYEWK